AYMGTRFIATKESLASEAYREMVLTAQATDVVYTSYFSGVSANYLKPSIEAAGLDLQQLQGQATGERKPWRDIWSAGQGVGASQ
ncbi:nitronate monooxygenase, partial [Xylella fastidiosa subsp. multiplex]|nr:nitronate monooxygenase [Xylella fastidiosa subsp. multiplex]